jgi:hypothetical protein
MIRLYDRGMRGLFPCVSCRRHVADEVCPFCGAAQPARAPHAPFAGALTRAAIFGAALAAPGCWTGAAPASTPPEVASSAPGAIEGVLTSSESGDPVANQRITLRSTGAPDRHATTDRDGRYRFDKVAPGNYVLVFLPPQTRGPSNMTTVQLGAGETQRVNWAALYRDPSNIPMPYGAPPARRRRV